MSALWQVNCVDVFLSHLNLFLIQKESDSFLPFRKQEQFSYCEILAKVSASQQVRGKKLHQVPSVKYKSFKTRSDPRIKYKVEMQTVYFMCIILQSRGAFTVYYPSQLMTLKNFILSYAPYYLLLGLLILKCFDNLITLF